MTVSYIDLCFLIPSQDPETWVTGPRGQKRPRRKHSDADASENQISEGAIGMWAWEDAGALGKGVWRVCGRSRGFGSEWRCHIEAERAGLM